MSTTNISWFRKLACRLGFHSVYAEPFEWLITISKHRCACCDRVYVTSPYADFYEDKNGNLQ